MSISNEFTSVYVCEWEINFLQCTPNGFLKYTELCNLIQLTASAHSELGGISFKDMQQFDQAWVLSRMRLEIGKMPKWKDKITIKTWINSLESSRSIRAIEVYIGNEKLVGVETFWVVFNTVTRRSELLVLPHEHYEKFPEKNATVIPFSKINLGNESKLVHTRTVVLSDLDIVNHVNNVKYLEWCLDHVAVSIILEQRIVAIDMNFTKELSLGDVVEIYSVGQNPDSTFSIGKATQSVFALVLSLN